MISLLKNASAKKLHQLVFKMAMNLSFWEKETFFAPQDVIIVGSGFAGLWSALQLITLHPEYKITILERGIIPTGASTRNAGFSCFGSPSELLTDIAAMGEEKMWQLVEKRFNGLTEIRKHFTDAEIDYDDCGGYECFTDNSEDWQQSNTHLSLLNNGLKKITGIDNIFKIADQKLTDFGFKGFQHLIENKAEGGLHSGKLIQALLQKVQGCGVQVLTGIEVNGYLTLNNAVEVNCKIINAEDLQYTFTTKKLLLCTNAFTKKLLPELDIVPNRGQVFITAPIPDLPFRGTFHFDKGYYYFRNVGNRLLIGGARNKAIHEENVDDFNITSLIQNELERFTKSHLLPDISYTITDRWSGIMAMGTEKSPIVQQVSDRVFCCVRMSGMGVALAPVIAKEIAELME